MDPPHSYKNLASQSHSHHDDDNDSSTEVESLVGLEKHWVTDGFKSRTRRRSKRSTCVAILKASRWFLVIGLQVVIVALLARDQGLLSSLRLGSGRRTTSAQDVGGDVTGWGPHSMIICFTCSAIAEKEETGLGG